jgi:hypothetical protein
MPPTTRIRPPRRRRTRPDRIALRRVRAEAYAAASARRDRVVRPAGASTGSASGRENQSVKNPPILISVLGFFGLMVGLYYIFAGLRILGFNFFSIFATAPVTGGWGFWGAMWVIVGLVYIAAAGALWTLQPWGWLFAVILSVFALISAFFVMFDAGLAAALGAVILPGIILWYLNTDEVKKAFDVEGTDGGV